MSSKLARQVLKDLYHPLPHNVEFLEGASWWRDIRDAN